MKREESINLDVYMLREKGRVHCLTEGSNHYKGGRIEPIEYAIANDRFEDFAIVNITKYIDRFPTTRNPEDLKKIVDYAHILCGVELTKGDEE